MYRPSEDDFFAGGINAASSAEPFNKPDHKSKKHGRPARKPAYKHRYPRRPRNGEEIGGGHFVFRRGDSTGRIRPCEWPYEHPNFESAMTEAARLAATYGGEFDVFARVASASADKTEAELADGLAAALEGGA